ncbi:hypothetical protein C5Y96_19070 [Blastopirellula marina]|uniref:HNH nuclease domain-containing protein n=1 Tax=Blastopirellula marina TaxID=124 RepID=A0A2S8F678_9BACT|nr:hypothetical protein C5Y96_19070 [Blastopirellula marina]RCS48168.1 hypothetical protein DTL36_19100 [Bremerella cremea]
MQWRDLYDTEEWQRTREFVYERHGGKCHICGNPGRDTHHLRYDQGFYNPDYLILVCRPCHRIWQGDPPNHLPDSNHKKPALIRVAEIARALKSLVQVYNPNRGLWEWVPKTWLEDSPC